MSKRSPVAVRLPWKARPYQEALPICSQWWEPAVVAGALGSRGAGGLATTEAETAMANRRPRGRRLERSDPRRWRRPLRTGIFTLELSRFETRKSKIYKDL